MFQTEQISNTAARDECRLFKACGIRYSGAKSNNGTGGLNQMVTVLQCASELNTIYLANISS
jgi:hypothetical protein